MLIAITFIAGVIVGAMMMSAALAGRGIADRQIERQHWRD
jgi:hypothetical protein